MVWNIVVVVVVIVIRIIVVVVILIYWIITGTYLKNTVVFCCCVLLECYTDIRIWLLTAVSRYVVMKLFIVMNEMAAAFAWNLCISQWTNFVKYCIWWTGNEKLFCFTRLRWWCNVFVIESVQVSAISVSCGYSEKVVHRCVPLSDCYWARWFNTGQPILINLSLPYSGEKNAHVRIHK